MLMSFTVIAVWPALPSDVALIVAEPWATPVTRPLVDTVARLGSLVDHVIVRPVRMLPAASLATATRRSVSAGPIVMAAGVTATDATALDPGPVDSLLHDCDEDATITASPIVRRRGQLVMGRCSARFIRLLLGSSPHGAGGRRPPAPAHG